MLTIKNLKHNGLGTLRIYIKGGVKSTETIKCNRFESSQKSKEIAALHNGEVLKAYYNGKLL